MKKFSKIVEKIEQKKYKVSCNIELVIEAGNEGEASFLADKQINDIKNIEDFNISKIEQYEPISESKSEIKKELKDNKYQMVSGIIDILKKIRDKENRMEIANDMIKQFKKENIEFDYNQFLDSIK